MKGRQHLPFLAFLVVVVHLIAPSLAQNDCPPPDTLAPCTCEVTWRNDTIIFCTHITDPSFSLKEVLDRASEFISDNVIFHQLYIYNTTLTEIEEAAVQHLKFNWITIFENPNLEYISPRSFDATRNITSRLSLERNNLHNEPPHERDFFDLINSFQRLTNVDISRNNLTSIPANAFRNHPLLEWISIWGNWISRIGSRAFDSGSDSLYRLQLSWQSIPSAGLPEDAFAGISDTANVDLSYNGMDFLEQASYQSLLDAAKRVEIGIRECNPIFCWPARVFNCDERADWLCEKEEIYRPKLGDIISGSDFACKVASGYTDVWEYCAGRNNTK